MGADKTQRIDTLEKLVAARWGRRAVICPSSYTFRKPKPAAFMIQLSGEILRRLMRDGMFIYESKKPNKVKVDEDIPF